MKKTQSRIRESVRSEIVRYMSDVVDDDTSVDSVDTVD